MRRSLLAGLALLLVGVDSPRQARAEPPPPGTQGASERVRVRALFDEGAREYRAGRYDQAIDLFQRAYDLSRAPAILFNLAQAYRLKGRAFCGQALEYYRRSLAEDPDTTNREEIAERIQEMDRCVREEAATQEKESDRRVRPEPGAGALPAARPRLPDAAVDAGAVSARPSAERPGGSRHLLPLATIALGGVAAATGGLIYWRAWVKYDEIEPTCHPCAPETYSGWKAATDVSYVLMGAGVLAVGAGVFWWWNTSSARRPPVRAGVAPFPGGLTWTAEF